MVILFLLGSYVGQHPYFQIAQIDIVNEKGSQQLQHANRQQIFEAVLPYLTGSFFKVDVHLAQKAAQAMPWVEQAKVSRVSFSKIQIDIQEYQPIAKWLNEGYLAGLVSADGKVFQAESHAKLPEFDAAASELNVVAKQYHLLNGQLKSLRLDIERLKYDARGAWTIRLTNGVEVRLGRQDIHTRMQRFIQYWHRELSALAPYLDYVDMRYNDAFAIKLNPDAPDDINPLKSKMEELDNSTHEE